MATDLIVTCGRLGSRTLVTASGVVDLQTMPQLQAGLREMACAHEALTIDLTRVQAPTAAGKALLLNELRRVHTAHPQTRLVCPPGPFRSALERAGLARRIDLAERLPAVPPAHHAGLAVRGSGPAGCRAATPKRRRALLTEATVAIEAHHADPDLSLERVARRIATSSRQLQRVFAEVAGTTFRAELNAVRMQHAAELLQTSSLPVGAIARRVGHRQPAQFANAFRRHHGLSPTGWRRAARDAALTAHRADLREGANRR
jgi:AraC family transcriptional regulator, regulatory protein of adaptative response / methylphosphotriester-DNA alkyltransferase methyltransferase